HFQYDLILILRLLDQIEIVLRIRVPQNREDFCFRHSVGLSLIATQIDIDVGGVVIKIRRNGKEARVWPELGHQLFADLIDLFGIRAGNGVSILALLLTGYSGTDFQNRKGTQEGEHTGNRVELAHHPRGHLLDRLPLLGWAYESKHDALIRRHKSGGAGHSEIGDHIWILVQSLVDSILQLMHL